MDATIAAWIGFLGALVGGLIGAIGSYLGSVNATNRNIFFTQRVQELTAQAQLHRQIEFSLFKIETLYERVTTHNLYDKLFYVEHIIYDPEWHKHLAILLDYISVEHQDILVLWFDSLARFISSARSNDGYVNGAEIVKFVGEVSTLREDVVEVLKFIVTLRE